MPENICFGCGPDNEEGLEIKSTWEGEISVCHWQPDPKYSGWPNLLNGGIIATLIDCHCMNTAMADAYRREDRDLNSQPIYRYATGSLSVRYEKPTPIDKVVRLQAKVLEVKKRKTVLSCEVIVDGVVTATSEVVAIRVFDSGSQDATSNPFG